VVLIESQVVILLSQIEQKTNCPWIYG